jgi:hypothetical protein
MLSIADHADHLPASEELHARIQLAHRPATRSIGFADDDDVGGWLERNGSASYFTVDTGVALM